VITRFFRGDHEIFLGGATFQGDYRWIQGDHLFNDKRFFMEGRIIIDNNGVIKI
jgi:hypothetical protein